MPNYIPVNSGNNPLDKKSLILPLDYQAAQAGVMYQVTTGSQTFNFALGGGFLLLQITIPANSSKTIYVCEVSSGSLAYSFILDVFINATFTATGTLLTPFNANSSFSNSSSMTAKWLKSSSDPTSGGTRIGSFSDVSGGLNAVLDGSTIITSASSAQTFYLRITNNGPALSTNRLVAGVSWWELPTGQKLFPNG